MDRRRSSWMIASWLCWIGCSDAGQQSAPVSDGGRDSGAGSFDAGSDAAPDDAGSSDASTVISAGDFTRDVPGFTARPYHLHVPPAASKGKKIPVVLVLHGGGSNAEGTPALTCPLGDRKSPRCLNAVADRAGFAVVYPNGFAPASAPNTRTWNAGGGTGDFQCVSGPACARAIDDIAYVDALLDDLATLIAVDDKRVYATGISNGAAMSHRLACERADRIAAIASVAGGNQFATGATCAPARPIAVMELHGTADPCWAFDGGSAACAQMDGKNKIDVVTTMNDWAMRNGCAATPETSALPDTAADDGTQTHVERHVSCNADVEVTLLRIEGGGHTWPGGLQYQSTATIGPVAQDFDANEVIWQFFAAHARP